MAEHTPGPWHVDAKANMSSFAVKPNKPTDAVGVVCACRWRHRRTDHVAEARANARLIASAPDLLAALEGMMEANPTLRTHGIGAPHSEARNRQVAQIEAEDDARAAIRKARGTEGA